MRASVLLEPPDADLAVELFEFERQFRYPLDRGWFRIDHGVDYNRFYRSLGNAVYVVARDDSGVLGVCSAACRELHGAGATSQTALYLGDLKIAPRARGGQTLLKLANALRDSFPGVGRAYSVVMNGTHRTPVQYTGRVGLPEFRPVGEVRIWRVSTAPALGRHARATAVSSAVGEALFQHLSGKECFSLSGDPQARSDMPVQWWIADDERACGRLEDTRLAKRLFRHDGVEMISAHLAAFAYSRRESADALLDAVRGIGASVGIPALFLARPDSPAVLPSALEEAADGTVVSGATIYATGICGGPPWNIFTSEI